VGGAAAVGEGGVIAPVHLRLWISARSVRSQRAIVVGEQLQRWLATIGGSCDILEVGEHPDLAAEDRILATPTLVRVSPEPLVRIIGDVSDLTQLALRLGLPDEITEPRGTR
jgi:circadian clock protein KaiB